MKSRSSGQVRIIEAFLAVLLVFSSFAISANLTITQNTTRHYDLTSIGLQALMKLDSDGSLGEYIDDKDWTALLDTLNLVVPAGVSFNLTVYDEQMQQINTDVISNGAFNSQETAFVEYGCASRSSVFHCYIIYLYLRVAA